MNEYIKLDILEHFPTAFDFEFFHNHVTCKIPREDSHFLLGVTYIAEREIFRVFLEKYSIIPVCILGDALKFFAEWLEQETSYAYN